MRKMLSEVKSLTLENFIMPEEDSFEEETPVEADNEEEVLQTNPNDMSSIEKELTQIRKIALSVINRLADPFFLTVIFAVIPIVDILAPIDTVTIFVYVFILTGLVIEAPFCHMRTSSILEDILQHFECGRFLGVFF